jgi:hypothetical protein
MTGLGYHDVHAKPAAFLALTSLTLEAFAVLGPDFEKAFQAHMAQWRLAGPQSVDG